MMYKVYPYYLQEIYITVKYYATSIDFYETLYITNFLDKIHYIKGKNYASQMHTFQLLMYLNFLI